jgi:hypothetical protein
MTDKSLADVTRDHLPILGVSMERAQELFETSRAEIIPFLKNNQILTAHGDPVAVTIGWCIGKGYTVNEATLAGLLVEYIYLDEDGPMFKALKARAQAN